MTITVGWLTEKAIEAGVPFADSTLAKLKDPRIPANVNVNFLHSYAQIASKSERAQLMKIDSVLNTKLDSVITAKTGYSKLGFEEPYENSLSTKGILATLAVALTIGTTIFRGTGVKSARRFILIGIGIAALLIKSYLSTGSEYQKKIKEISSDGEYDKANEFKRELNTVPRTDVI